ncbi:cobalamin biosynthesis protein CobQ [Actinoplanes sp. NPDC049596]|uniref:MinD/ParA family ATP-binding protein n=1 Tax=unclassified Actinoplanes TaxID=2626549 RepID=UPI00343F3A89
MTAHIEGTPPLNEPDDFGTAKFDRDAIAAEVTDRAAASGGVPPSPTGRPVRAPEPDSTMWTAPAPVSAPSLGGTPSPIGLDARPAQWGWRGRANRLAHGALTIGAGPEERLHRAARRRLLRPFKRAMTVVVANPKGGAAKTPTALLAGATLGFHRGGYTLVWDNNETRGTLGIRAEDAPHGRTVVDLLQDIDDFLSVSASVGRLSGYLRPQSARFDVLASDDKPGAMDIIDDAAVAKLWTALSRYYRLLVVDTGNNVRSANWRAVTDLADCLVVPTTVQSDVADSGLWMLDHLRRSGHQKLAANAVAVVSCADPRTDPELLRQITERYREVVRDVVVIPHDPYVRSGGRIEYDHLAVATRRAWLLACTSIIDSLGLADQRAEPPK